MLTNFDECTVLGERKSTLKLPLSTTSHRFTVLLREGDHILNPAGRWEILWEDEQGSVHNSMRPPALPRPLIPSDALEPLETESTDAVEPVEAKASQASPVASSKGYAVEPVEASPREASSVAAGNEAQAATGSPPRPDT